KNIAKYQIPEKRSAQFALLDGGRLRAETHISDNEIKAYYQEHIDEYKVQNSARVEQILFKTLGKTDAEIAEIRQKAEEVDKQAKHGRNFEDLAKKCPEDDPTKDKGGDRGWIVAGQAAPPVEQPACRLQPGSV